MSKYIIKLIPTGRFFFGGDMTFTIGKQKETDKSKGEKDSYQIYNEEFSSYIISSLKFPQQTSLLGMLRFLLLSNNDEAFDVSNQIIKDKGKAKNLIGEKSFSVNPDHEENKFGKIRSVGTCFLCKGDQYYYQAPFDYDWELDNFEEAEATLNGKSISIPMMKKGKEDYSSKDGINKCYLTSNGNVLKEEDVFQEDSRIGIRRGTNGKTEEEAFYKQIGYRLKDDCCFAFNVEVDDVDLTESKYTNQLVTVGADSSMFVIKIEEGSFQVGLPDSYLKSGAGWEKVVLLADTYLPETELAKYAICETKPFRFFKTTVDTTKYHIMHNLNNRSNRYSLYAAGSVFFAENDTAFKECILTKKEFVQIGYNHCK